MRKKLPMIKWENLKIEVVEERFAGVVEEKLREEQGKVKQDMTGWPRVTEVVLGAAKDVCGEAAKGWWGLPIGEEREVAGVLE